MQHWSQIKISLQKIFETFLIIGITARVKPDFFLIGVVIRCRARGNWGVIPNLMKQNYDQSCFSNSRTFNCHIVMIVCNCHICCHFPLGREFPSKFIQSEQNHTWEVLFRREINDNRLWVLLIPVSGFLLLTPEFTQLCDDNFSKKLFLSSWSSLFTLEYCGICSSIQNFCLPFNPVWYLQLLYIFSDF